jgi:hypothetical protein
MVLLAAMHIMVIVIAGKLSPQGAVIQGALIRQLAVVLERAVTVILSLVIP